jgi:hypothetical protein
MDMSILGTFVDSSASIYFWAFGAQGEMLEAVEHLEAVSNPGTPCPTNRRGGAHQSLSRRKLDVGWAF